jgi:biopolymer transport protein ExbD
MITRPLDLSSKLRPPPRSYEFLFFVNAGLIVLFFGLFGSRFILSPGLGIDFSVPVVPTALSGAVATDVVVAVKGADLAFVEGAKVNFAGLRQYLAGRAKGQAGLRLLVQADSTLPASELTEVYDMARDAGFASVQIAAEPVAKP